MNEGALKKRGLRTELYRLPDRHAGVDAKPASGMGGGLHHTPLVPASAHDQQLDVPQLGVILAAYLDEEGVKVHMKESRWHRGAYTRRMAVALQATIRGIPGRSPMS